MRFARPLLRLPIRFSAETLEREASSLPKSAWVAHPNAFPGNDAVRLITTGGAETDAIGGSMGPTEHLRDALALPVDRNVGDSPGADMPPISQAQ